MFSEPSQIVSRLGIKEGMVVVDFGAGSGAYSLAAAALVGSGAVFAVDVQKGLLDRLAAEARDRRLDNIHIVWGDLERPGGSKLKDELADLIIVANTLFQADARYSLALEVKRVLRRGGRAAVIDWSGSFGGLGPPTERVVSPEETTKIFQKAGFEPAGEFPAGEHHYGLLFAKTNS